MKRTALVALSIVSALLMVTCSQGSEDEPTDNWLLEAIRTVPDDYGLWNLMFTNREQARLLADAKDFGGIPVMLEGESIPWTYEALAHPPEMLGNIVAVHEQMGIDFQLTDYTIWVDQPFHNVPRFMMAEGGFHDADELSSTLEDMGYRTSSHHGVTYYHWIVGDKMNLRRIREHGTSAYPWFGLNTIAPIGKRLILAQRAEWTKNLIDVHHGSRPSLYDLEHYRELTQAVGDDLLAGAFVTPELATWIWTDLDWKPVERLDQYISGPKAWGDLEPYTVAVVGSAIQDGETHTMVALHYSDPDGAARNAAELKRRWDSAYFHIGELTTFSSASKEPRPRREPFASYCTSLQTRTVVINQASVLVGTCRTFERTPGGPAYGGPYFWWTSKNCISLFRT